MINLPFAENKTYYVVGLGKSNRAAVKVLKKAKADVRVWDDNPDNLAGFDDKIICSVDKAPWSKIKAVIAAPGVPPAHEILQTADEKNVPVICDINLFALAKPSTKIIGVTGTNGKSTVTALIHHILNFNGKAQMGGNIGHPVLDLKSKADFTVLELSSYQLDRAPDLTCEVAVLLNITQDHLDWHGDMEAYIAAKEKIFDGAHHKIISIDDEHSKAIFERQDNAQSISVFTEDLPFNPMEMPKMKGQHNLQNMLAAYEACRALEIEHDIIVERMKSFEGLPHRQYLVKVINGVPYINDSKATNAEASRAALKSFRNIIWIAGGQPKDGGLSAIEGDLANVQKAFLYGAAKDDFAKFLSVRGIEVEAVDTMDEALSLAHASAQDMRGEPTGAPTVLLSPACASFDQFKNFEERGDHFAKLVDGLENE